MLVEGIDIFSQAGHFILAFNLTGEASFQTLHLSGHLRYGGNPTVRQSAIYQSYDTDQEKDQDQDKGIESDQGLANIRQGLEGILCLKAI